MHANCVAWWDFAQEIHSERIRDRGPLALHGTLRNLPTRAVRGSRWNGEEMNWRLPAPALCRDPFP